MKFIQRCTLFFVLGVVLLDSKFPIDTNIVHIPKEGEQRYPTVAFDGGNYLVAWQDDYGDIYGTRVSPSGAVIDSFVVATQPGDQISPLLAHGLGDQILITYSGWTDSINCHLVNTMRIWGKFYPFGEIEENARQSIPYTIGSLGVYPNPFTNRLTIKYQIPNSKPQNSKSQTTLKIYDATGRLVRNFELSTRYSATQYGGLLATSVEWDGTDDARRRLASGIYFVMIEGNNFLVVEKVVKLE